ncbi:hypothetical protein OG413_45340 [Streptomyces sp. NBC_01433]|uniref:hypothetical protein n=1 Tax=Streptomyces sp. NBC_01433 TaxID=2903864 RepID=UPI002250933D|nr:hypothetical protein [Streptomyces sp. NBC_01433]MCX4681336.1 hypothetical protein [Streptomyces sp. NBC_01433]MCX4681726.1 hypothetical protein [Streptomyces sp. NBC_01433]MCX4682412.1 hypothetical protein [Streptomyces sp. NBC_01433]
MADEPEKTPIQNKYAQQYANDLAANRKEQGDITTQITGLQERLEQLKVEESWLGQAQGSLPGTAALNESEAAAAVAEEPPAAKAEQPEISAPAAAVTDAPTTVPQPRQDQSVKVAKQPAKKSAAKKTPAKKVAAKKTPAKKVAAKEATTAKKAAAKKSVADQAPAPEAATTEAPADKAAGEEKSGPPLWQLILDILLKTPGQPCMAREVTDQLAQEHPKRATTIQTVRNNLEGLVKKNRAEKSRQQGNAMYIAHADADVTAGGEGEQAPEAAAEKVPAEV